MPGTNEAGTLKLRSDGSSEKIFEQGREAQMNYMSAYVARES